MTPPLRRSKHSGRRRVASRDAELEETRLPYLVDAAWKLRYEKCGSWASPTAAALCEERLQNNGDDPFGMTKTLSFGARKGIHRSKCAKTYSPRLPPEGLNTTSDEKYPSLPALDERVLILYHSSLKRARKKQQQQETESVFPLFSHYGHEANFAATQIQKVARGVAARVLWRAFYCLRNQSAATRIQFAFHRMIVRRKVLLRLTKKRNSRATQIQAWYRGHRCRDLLLYQHIRIMNQRMVNFQRYIRGRRLWQVVMGTLHRRRCNMATHIQRCYRGWKGRQRAVAIRFEQNRHVRHLVHESEVHAQCSRCDGCSLESCTEDSLFACFMVRFVGLHDFKGARILAEDGLRLFPSSFRFSFFFSALLQSMGEDMETIMVFLKRAKEIGINDEELLQCETHYLLPAHLLRPSDVQAYLDLAIMCQSRGHLSRAEANYSRALAQSPHDYAIPGYLHRLHMIDRLLLNYHRFCSIFNFRQVNVLQKDISTSKKGKKIRVLVSKFNHYTVIAPAEDSCDCRSNALYLTDDEVLTIIKPPSRGPEKEYLFDTENTSRRGMSSWDSSSLHLSVQQKSIRSVVNDTPERSSRLLLQKPVLTQLYQHEITGLTVRPSDLAQFSDSRSKLRLTKPNAELLLRKLVFVDPTSTTSESSQADGHGESSTQVFNNVMLIPSILKLRQLHRNAMIRAHAVIDTQRVYRGFRLRAKVRREKLLSEIKHQQADEMYRRLHENYVLRELRRTSAVAIQRIYKGYAFRNLLRQWQIQACHIQRIFRGYRGRLRAAAFRDGSCSFFMAQRVFQRGMNISGHPIVLVIEKCGLSFRLDGYDLEACVMYHGFFSHASSMNLLCYLNWIYGETLCGREFTRKGDKMIIRSISAINHLTGECFVFCDALTGGSTMSFEVPLVECIQAINLRNFGVGDKVTPVLQLPITPDDTARLVQAIAERAVLIAALRAPTKELKTRDSTGLVISIQPPPQMHFTYQRTSRANHSNHVPNVSPSASLKLQFVYPVVDGLRGVTIGKKNFRKKCTRHAVEFTRCRCMLPTISSAAHIEAIGRALAPPFSAPTS